MDENILNTPIEYLKGVGPNRANALNKDLNIYTFGDLLYHFPFRYIDRTKFYKIAELDHSMSYVQTIVVIKSKRMSGKLRGKRLTCQCYDDTGTMELAWFQGIQWIDPLLKVGERYVLFGKTNIFNGVLQMTHPELELYRPEKMKSAFNASLYPVYSSTEKLKKLSLDSKGLSKLQKTLLLKIDGILNESLPYYIRDKYKLWDINTAVKNIHFPKNNEDLRQAQRRLKFSELFFIQLRLLYKKKYRKEKIRGSVFMKEDIYNDFLENKLPFELTDAQSRVLNELKEDMTTGIQMNRLVQGDVGSGKTIVAVMTMLIAYDNDAQSCFMAPTEILAQQQFENTRTLLAGLGLNIEILTGSTKKKEREKILSGLELGEIDILFGTHALIEDTVKFKNLGLAVIDEQHRFGVAQRAKLYDKNDPPPHILVMTATPIPRTLAMTLYGDLDVSIIDELPKGRKPVITKIVKEKDRDYAYRYIRKEVVERAQVYIVYPLIEESEALDLKNLNEGFEDIKTEFPPTKYPSAMLHGRMKNEEKEAVMNKFKSGETSMLVSTTVVEVGVDVPNASVMLIENAERFGLAQLHQLRGRVGRGAKQSYLFLMVENLSNPVTRDRLKIMEQTNDGFEIAEQDLKIRGPGEFEGTRQSGMIVLKISDLVKDQTILQEARKTVENLLDADPNLRSAENIQLRRYIERLSQSSFWQYIS